ncbi:MAG: ABC transporter ATP-binding protein [Lactobacillus sp.]|nr:ABC transporter ATP-binding protein [Lactobacillus sp.]
MKKEKLDRQTVIRLLKVIFKTTPVLTIISAISVVISAGASVIGALFIEQLINKYITPLLKQAHPDFTPLLDIILVMAVVYLFGAFATYLFNMLMGIAAQKVQMRIRQQMFAHMQRLPISYFDQNEFGDIMSRYTNDIDALMQMISQSLPQFVSSILSLVFVVMAMLSISWQLTAFSFIILLLSLFVVKTLTTKSSQYFIKQQKHVGQLNGYNEEMLTGLKVVKVFSHEKNAKEEFDQYNEELRKISGNANAIATSLFPIMGNLGNLLYVLISVLGGAIAVHSWAPLSLGAIAAFLQLSKQFSMPIAQISQQLNSIVMANAGAARIFELLDTDEEVDDGQITLVKKGDGWDWQDGDKLTPVAGHIKFDQVNFSYDGEKQILYGIDIDAKPGMKVALVGETGAGKTTISNMINRFYDIDSGQITYDGLPIKDIKKDDLRSSLTIVLQDTHLFTGTILDNIRFSKPEATDEEVIQAAKLAHADEFITGLTHGYDTVIDGNGGDLSQGQMQLLSISRAMLADRPVMILDEATSSIDTNTERLVQQGMNNLLKGRTSFVIAHRLSTIVDSDLILVLDHGHIIEAGSHDELLAKKGYYYELYTGVRELD